MNKELIEAIVTNKVKDVLFELGGRKLSPELIANMLPQELLEELVQAVVNILCHKKSA